MRIFINLKCSNNNYEKAITFIEQNKTSNTVICLK